MMNKKTLLIILGIGVLLYLWNKGYFKSKKTPVLVPEPPVTTEEIEAETKYFDTSTASVSPSPMTQTQPSLDGGLEQVAGTTIFDETAGEVFSDHSALATGSFGYVRRPR